MADPLGVGIIGLGCRWQRRYRPALLAMPGQYRVRALCDQVQPRAALEAKRFGCSARLGVTALLESADIDALLLLDEQWYGLWPVEVACRLGKPVFCCGSLEREGPRADALCRQVRASRLPVMVEMMPRFAPAANRLRELLETHLGPACLLVCEVVEPHPHAGPDPGFGLGTSQGTALLDWLFSLLGCQPVSILSAGTSTGGFTSTFLDFGPGRAAQVTCRHEPHTSHLRLQVVAERGSALVELPARVRWTTHDGRHTHIMRGHKPIGQLMLEKFHEAVKSGRAPEPGLDDAQRVLSYLRAAASSRVEGRRVELSAPQA